MKLPHTIFVILLFRTTHLYAGSFRQTATNLRRAIPWATAQAPAIYQWARTTSEPVPKPVLVAPTTLMLLNQALRNTLYSVGSTGLSSLGHYALVMQDRLKYGPWNPQTIAAATTRPYYSQLLNRWWRPLNSADIAFAIISGLISQRVDMGRVTTPEEWQYLQENDMF